MCFGNPLENNNGNVQPPNPPPEENEAPEEAPADEADDFITEEGMNLLVMCKGIAEGIMSIDDDMPFQAAVALAAARLTGGETTAGAVHAYNERIKEGNVGAYMFGATCMMRKTEYDSVNIHALMILNAHRDTLDEGGASALAALACLTKPGTWVGDANGPAARQKGAEAIYKAIKTIRRNGTHPEEDDTVPDANEDDDDDASA